MSIQGSQQLNTTPANHRASPTTAPGSTLERHREQLRRLTRAGNAIYTVHPLPTIPARLAFSSLLHFTKDTMEQTSQATLELLESRVRRVEHLLYGGNTPEDTHALPAKPTVDALADLERRFSSLVSNVRVYAELLKICTSIPA